MLIRESRCPVLNSHFHGPGCRRALDFLDQQPSQLVLTQSHDLQSFPRISSNAITCTRSLTVSTSYQGIDCVHDSAGPSSKFVLLLHMPALVIFVPGRLSLISTPWAVKLDSPSFRNIKSITSTVPSFIPKNTSSRTVPFVAYWFCSPTGMHAACRFED